MTLLRICPALRPRSGRRARPLRHLGTAPVCVTTKAPAVLELSRLNHTASTVAAYASRLGHPARARLASGCWPALPGGIGYPQGHYRRFPSATSSHPPSPGLAWRDTHPLLENLPKVRPRNRVEKLAYIKVYDPPASHVHELMPQGVKGLVWGAAGPEPPRAVQKVLLV